MEKLLQILTTYVIIIEIILLVKCNLEKKGGRMLLSKKYYSIEMHAKRTGEFLFKSRNMTGEIIWTRKKKELLGQGKRIFV